MSKAAELIAGLQSDAEFDSEGAFSLDREKARQKMRQFQLADPHRYVLLLVEAAVLRGATKIDFIIDADDMRMRFDASLDYEDLDELYTSLFVDRSSTEIQARRELALACNAAMALNPRWVQIESWARSDAGITGVRALLRPDESDTIERIEQAPNHGLAPWTEIHVKERFRPGLLVRFVHDLGDALPEELLIRERCALASVSITLDGRQISHGLPRHAIAAVNFQAEGLRGVVGISPEMSKRSAMVLLSNGVEISTTELSDSVPGVWFWVDSANLRKDVSQTDVVRSDPSYHNLLAEVARARDSVLGRLFELWRANEFNAATSLTATQVFDLLRGCFVRWADANWMRPNAGPLGQLADLPLWRTVDQRWIAPRALAVEVGPEGSVAYTTRDFDGVTPLDYGPVIHAIGGAQEVEAIKRVYANQVRDVSVQLEREVAWELNRRKWRAQIHAPELPRGAGARTIQFAANGYVGELAMRPIKGCDVRLVVDGCLLSEAHFDLGSLGFAAVLSGPMTPARDYASPRHDRIYATGLMLLLGQIPRLIADWAEAGGAEQVLLSNLAEITQSNFAREWLEAFGFERKFAQEMVSILGVPPLLPALDLGSGQPGPIAHLLRFTTVDGRKVALIEIDEERRSRVRKRDMVLVVDRSVPASAGLDELILCVDSSERGLLTAIFGAALIHDDSLDYRRNLGRRRFLAQPKIEPSLGRAATWMTPVEYSPRPNEASVRGVVGVDATVLRHWQADKPRKSTIEVIVEDRKLVTLEEKAWLPGVSASLVWEQARVNPDWDKLAGPTDALQRAVNAGVIAIIRARAIEAIDSNARPDDDVRRMLWLAMAAPFISVEHAQAWRRFRAELEFNAAVDAYFDLLVLFPAITLSDLREGIALLLEADTLPTRAAVLGILQRADKRSGGGREFQRAILELFETLERVPLIDLASSSDPISLAKLTQHQAATGEIAHVEDLSLRFETDEYIIVRADPIDHVGLIRLFGREEFHEVSAWIHERRHQYQFESRAPLESLRVPDKNRLVGVEFEHEGVRGELAIPPWMPKNSGLMKLVYCHNRRIVETIEVHAALPVLGLIDDPEATLSTDYSRVATHSPRMAVIRKLLDEVLAEQLLPALAEAYPRLAVRQQRTARRWIAAHWRKSSPRAGQHLNRLGEAGRQFAALPLFCDTDGTPRSLLELSERNREQQRIWYLDRDPGDAVTPPFPVLLRRPDEHELLAELFETLEDFSPRWSAWIDGEKRRKNAPDMPDLRPPNSALVVAPVTRHGLEGALWLPDRHPFDSGVIMGDAGKVLTVKDIDEQLLAQGAINGELADDCFEAPALAHAQTRYLNLRVISLYSELLAQHKADLARPERPDFLEPEQVRIRAIRLEQLRAAAINLARAQRHGRSFDAILGNLVERLEQEPLLRLSTGRLISVDIARKARPQEHAHLDIWNPLSWGLSPSERARLLLGEPEKVEPEPEPEKVEPEPEPEKVEPAEAMTQMSPEPEPVPMAPPEPTIDRVGAVLERIREELRLLREHHAIVLSDGQLDSISVDARNGKNLLRIEENGVLFDSEHPRFIRATEDSDPIWVSFLASVAYTGLNRWLDEVTDDDERVFHHRHTTHLLSGLV